jgi:hypothetical protein
MTTVQTAEVPIRPDRIATEEVAELAYRLWLADGFATVSPEAALFAAFNQYNRKPSQRVKLIAIPHRVLTR